MLFSHIVLGADDIAAARAFYEPVMAALGAKLVQATDTVLVFGRDNQFVMVGNPRDGNPATAANGGTIGFVAASADQVDAFHAAGLANGGSEEGAPGIRPQVNRYGAYLRDPVGNKICAFVAAD